MFVDPVVKGLKYHAVAVHRDPVSTYQLKLVSFSNPEEFIITNSLDYFILLNTFPILDL